MLFRTAATGLAQRSNAFPSTRSMAVRSLVSVGETLPSVDSRPSFTPKKQNLANLSKPKTLGSYVISGPNWARSAAVYESKMGATGDVINARSFFSASKPEEHAAKSKQISSSEVKSLFGLWNDALATLDSDTVAKRYAKEAVLLPTVSDTPRTDYAGIKDYFVNFLQKNPQGKIVESYPLVGDGWCKDVGIYDFTMGASGDKVRARYSFVYVYEDGEWKISHHHSSVIPESVLGN